MPQQEKAIDLNTLKKLFQKSADIQFQDYVFNQNKVHFITCDAMIDQQMLNEVIIRRIQYLYDHLDETPFEENIKNQLHIPALQKVQDKADAITLVYTGSLLLYFEKEGLLYASNIAKKPNRNPEETRMEVLVKGPRDNFIEDIRVNIALLRKRLPTNSFCVEKVELGKRSKTNVAILYFDDIVDMDILHGIKKQLAAVDTDIVFSGDVLMERINKNSKLFPKFDYTGRPDYAIQALIRGRFLMFVDGVAYAMITPVNLFLLLKSAEDNEYPIIFSSIERLLRILGILIGLLLPAFWLSLTTYHQNQLPFQLLATVVQAKTGLPLPSSLEMLIMLLMFELFREAGLRLPSVIGGTISVVGGLIIGDAAIRAGVTSPEMIVVIAISTIASFTLVNQSLVTTISLLRVTFIIASAFFGLFGFFVSLFFTLLYLCNIRIYGYSYMNLATDLNWMTIKKSIFRLSPKGYTERNKALAPQDSTRTSMRKKKKKQQ
ncbi:spore gernimation protein [Lysinibacillus sphaericus]|uniref:spore germination protein n=1 Tax=Lysinibacillus sphaericus TaxID=1421 RepID=UPI0018CFC938|nr:spore germination protein [Lysinibacillus sphaericus]MBG9455418.1 spore gernimation protein [Lysinibacillus sphaericus]MBG9478473.1 spore gernimation protein [Lysinibacillus sphaericus]MBG9594763.1 spore gernimation protein [Lysinibacillus sphaericus]